MILSAVGSYVLASTLVVAVGENASSNQQWMPMANEASCKNAMEMALQGKTNIIRHDAYTTAQVDVEGIIIVQRLQCLPQNVDGAHSQQ